MQPLLTSYRHGDNNVWNETPRFFFSLDILISAALFLVTIERRKRNFVGEKTVLVNPHDWNFLGFLLASIEISILVD